MSQIRSRKRSPSAPLLALLAALPAAGLAQQESTLPTTTVKETMEVPYKADTSANPKYTQPLLNTPKTIQVIKKETLEEQGALTLMEALRNTPGITMQMGENGNSSAGDTFQMRGSSMQQNTFVDGVRDLGAVTRDTFNLEQIEVIKGAAGAETGRGTGTGYINLISKQAHLGDENSGSVTLGTAQKKRATVDLNKQLSETSAIRINGMVQDSGVDGRNIVENKGQGLGLSYVTGLGTPTRIHLYSQHIRQDNVPDGGLPTIGMPGYYHATAQVRNGSKVDRENFYGSASDFEKVNADMITAKVEHDLGQGTTVRNITRWGRNHMERVLTGVNTNNNLTIPDANNPSTWQASRSRQGVDQVNSIIANQTSLNTAFSALGLQHTLAAGVELIREDQENLTFATVGTTPNANLYNPNPYESMASLVPNGAKVAGNTTTLALYASDNAKINEQFAINGGMRVDRYRLATRNTSAGGVPGASLDDEGTLLSWSIGGVYKPAPNGSIYSSYADAKTPPGGDSFVLNAGPTNQANPSFDPQVTRTVELGSKWELLDKRLNVAGALFRSVNDGQISYEAGSSTPLQVGKKQVQGIELSAVGQLTRYWQITAGVVKSSTKQLDQRSNTGITTSVVSWAPDFTATAWTSYQLEQLTLGLGARHVSEQTRAQINDSTNVAATNMVTIPSYSVFDAMATYQINPKVSLRLNVYNLFDKEYITSLNNAGSRMFLGAPRSAAVTANVKF